VAEARVRAEKKGTPLRVMFQDEARVGRMGDPKACWAPMPVRPEVPAQLVRQYTHVFGAVSPADGQHDSLILPYADTDAMSLFLKEVARRHRGERVLMFMDQAAWHKAGALKVPRGMELAYLPPYSPDLNPQEQVWDWLREKHLANMDFKSLDEVEDAAEGGLRRMEAAPAAMASLAMRGWMRAALGVVSD